MLSEIESIRRLSSEAELRYQQSLAEPHNADLQIKVARLQIQLIVKIRQLRKHIVDLGC